MAGVKDIANVWKNIKEVDLRPIRMEAEKSLRIAIVGHPGSGRHTLANQMRIDPDRPQEVTQTALMIADVASPDWVKGAELIILVLDATASDYKQEQELARQWMEAGMKVLAIVNKLDLLGQGQVMEHWLDWRVEKILYGSVQNVTFLKGEFVPAVLALLPESTLALARQFPLFRLAVANQLVNETSFSNAAYAFSTGLAEIVPVFDIPLNITDMIVLTKAQAFLVYRLGLALGFSTRWQDYVAEFGSVIGSGFLWRQMARMLVGLIPVWGIVPKVAVSYAGTYVVGNAVLQWYLTGRHINSQQMRALYVQALSRGRTAAQNLAKRMPRPHMPRISRRKPKELPAPQATRNCPSCGKPNSVDAIFCQYCGKPLDQPASMSEG